MSKESLDMFNGLQGGGQEPDKYGLVVRQFEKLIVTKKSLSYKEMRQA